LRELAGDFIFTVADAAAAGMGGDAESSRRRLQSLLAESTPVSPDLRAWACGTLADICERLGQRAEAESCHRAARVLAPDLPHHLAAWADFLLAEGRWREAADLLQPHRENDLLGLRWACAKARLGEWDGLYADTVISLRAGERAAAARGEHGHAREEAMLYLELLDEPDIALARALRNWKCQREPLDARLVVACARAAGRPSAAAPVLSWRRHTGMEDVVLDRMLKLLEATP
jgi:predicted Zn-dependent protease